MIEGVEDAVDDGDDESDESGRRGSPLNSSSSQLSISLSHLDMQPRAKESELLVVLTKCHYIRSIHSEGFL